MVLNYGKPIEGWQMNTLMKAWKYAALPVVFSLAFAGEALALGTRPGSGGGEAPNMLVTMAPFLLMFVVMYFLIIRPQQKKQKEQQEMIDSLKKGDRVITSGGVHGLITGIKEKEGILVLQVAKDVQIEVSRGSVSKVLEGKK